MSTLFETVSKVHRSAELSDCEKYRWWLRRSWVLYENGQPRVGKGVCCFIMLNPSTADGMQDDPTIRKCIKFARAWGYDCLAVRNLFPWRATDPKELLAANRPDGGRRGDIELLTAMTADFVVAAWGCKVPFNRDQEALKLFAQNCPNKPLHCLKMSNGKPWHPLYIKDDTLPQIFRTT
jgi:hypothetical protein